MEQNDKTARGIDLSDLTDYTDRQRDWAKLELDWTRTQATKSLSQEPLEVEKPEADTFLNLENQMILVDNRSSSLG